MINKFFLTTLEIDIDHTISWWATCANAASLSGKKQIPWSVRQKPIDLMQTSILKKCSQPVNMWHSGHLHFVPQFSSKLHGIQRMGLEQLQQSIFVCHVTGPQNPCLETWRFPCTPATLTFNKSADRQGPPCGLNYVDWWRWWILTNRRQFNVWVSSSSSLSDTKSKLIGGPWAMLKFRHKFPIGKLAMFALKADVLELTLRITYNLS